MFYKHNDVPFLYFPRNQVLINKEIVLVEDVISAIKISKIHNCAALMGTELNLDKIKILHKIGKRKIILILDGNAYSKALKISNKFDTLFESFKVMPIQIDLDPKDLSFQVLRYYLGINLVF